MDIWESDRAHLKKEMDADITKRKIKKISFKHDGKVFVAEVGEPSPYDGNIVRAIYEDGKRGCFLVCGGTVTMAPKESFVEEA
jgi:hypothetical protein